MTKTKKILIVEDEISYTKLLIDQLTSKGYVVITANNGTEGLELAKTENPDLILLDIKMPKMDGLTMLHHLREDPHSKHTKVIMLTNLEPDENIIDNVIRDQPTYYYVKSDVKFIDLLEKISNLLV